jgi:hypothetical protein
METYHFRKLAVVAKSMLDFGGARLMAQRIARILLKQFG